MYACMFFPSEKIKEKTCASLFLKSFHFVCNHKMSISKNNMQFIK